jgi:hypothetical protein
MCVYAALSRHTDDEALTRQLLQGALAAHAWASVQQLPRRQVVHAGRESVNWSQVNWLPEPAVPAPLTPAVPAPLTPAVPAPPAPAAPVPPLPALPVPPAGQPALAAQTVAHAPPH